MTNLRSIKPLSFPDLKPAAFDGEKPTLEWGAPTDLYIDAMLDEARAA